ncbi:SidA/IucD/PvdA family monooxygenase [Catellatospora sp. KI3]|uniref:lysine N(6)-hydroxylase/L-ornithine N(5)-oxygenase family protein n=1 Tax=Catellatospora sp. KI3 TaxID=3041620 RepID=UPI002482FDA2|nr:SidA/IucD/PvdA family monooxygenase [Catellatospora sp. KI3]MDI1460790.1 SidA/IucD/PvdA family monooxygenase [Catellatospora sp. KI3]
MSAREPFDLAGVGLGPFNLSLAALADSVPGLRTVFFERQPEFRWHPGLLLGGTTLQVPFLADLVSLVDPTNPWSFLNYLRTIGRLFPFYFAEQWHPYRAEFDAYCRWAASELDACRFGSTVTAVVHDGELFQLTVEHGGTVETVAARNVVLGIGTEPVVPPALAHLLADDRITAVHSADYLPHRDELTAAGRVSVIGSGQSGAEVFLDLLRARPTGSEGLHWLARTEAFTPMEYSQLGLEQFAPEYSRYFQRLPETTRDALLARQWRLYKGISSETIALVYDELYQHGIGRGWPDVLLRPGTEVTGADIGADGVLLRLRDVLTGEPDTLTTDAVVLATGYTERPADALLRGLADRLVRDRAGRARVDEQFRLVLDDDLGGAVYVQNAERHTHGASAPDLGLGAWRSATILNSVTGKNVFDLSERSAFTTFGRGGRRHVDPAHGRHAAV